MRRAIASAATAIVLCGLISAAGPADAAALPYQDPSLPVADRVSDLLSRMSLDEKLGQMTQPERAKVTAADITQYRIGSVLSGGGSAPSPNNPTGWADMYDTFQRGALATPLQIPMIYGIDAVHGNNNVYGATLFPHNIGLGATRDPELVQRIGVATAEEVRGSGQDWTFAPCVCVARNDRWGRTYESFGENPALVSEMTTVITGLQGAPARILATAKHYVGDGGTTGGVDQGNTQVSEADLRAIHLPPFRAAVQRGVGSVMISFSSWNGQKLHGHRYLITDVLKGELGFTGFTVSDWAGIDQIDGQPGFSQAEVATAVNAGLDMIMVPTDWQLFLTRLKAAVQAGQIPLSRVDDANRRILTKKFEYGLFEQPLADRSYASTVGSAAHRTLAREAVRKSQVLLKNSNNVLPLAKTGGKLFVAGKSADDIGNQSGGWTLSWQGASGNTVPGTTVLQGIRNTVGSGATVTYSRDGTGIDGSYRAAIAVVGETPYAEGQGDRTGSMSLDSTDLATINRLRAAGVPVIVVLVSGRPLDIAAQVGNWNALLAAWLPGSEGAGVADVLFGDYAPTGKLPVTWMQSVSQQPINDGDGQAPLYAYGTGLTYGSQPPPDPDPEPQPSSCRVTYTTNDWNNGFTASVSLTNTGTAAVNPWSLLWTFAAGQRVTQAWSARVTQSGTTVTAAGETWNPSLAPGATVTFGFNGSHTGTNPRPTSFTLNGNACTTA
jgi:beta-glucosidase